jgi:hypothetical protein
MELLRVRPLYYRLRSTHFLVLARARFAVGQLINCM